MGVVLMVLLTIVLAGITVSAVYSDEMLSSMKPVHVADIDVNYVKGGVPDGPGLNIISYAFSTWPVPL